MSTKHTQEQQTCDLSLKFFSSPSIRTPRATKKWVISPQMAEAWDASRRSARFYVQCDCACR